MQWCSLDLTCESATSATVNEEDNRAKPNIVASVNLLNNNEFDLGMQNVTSQTS